MSHIGAGVPESITARERREDGQGAVERDGGEDVRPGENGRAKLGEAKVAPRRGQTLQVVVVAASARRIARFSLVVVAAQRVSQYRRERDFARRDRRA